MLTIKQCREKLNENGIEFTDEQIVAIRDFLYKLARINVDYVKINIRENDEKSNSVY